MSMHPRYRRSEALSAGAALAVLLLLASPITAAKQQAADGRQWSDWRPLAQGYVGRRREPARLDLPTTLRRSAATGVRTRGRAAARAGEEVTGLGAGSSAALSTARASTSTPVSALWLRTTEPGLYGVSITDLADVLGASAQQIRNKAARGRLSLTNAKNPAGNQDSQEARHPVSWYFDGASDRILFAGQAYDTFFTDENAYRFVQKRRGAQPVRVVKGSPPTATGTETSFADGLRFEEESDLNFSLWATAADQDADYWFWDYLWGEYQDVLEIPLGIPTPASDGTAQLRVTLRGATDLYPGDEHRVYAKLNGVEVGSMAVWDGFDETTLVADFDQGLLDPLGDNRLSLHNDYAPGTHAVQWLDSVEVDYRRQPVVVDGSLWLHQVAAGVQRVPGLTSPEVFVMESPGGTAALRRDIRVESDGAGGWAAVFETVGGKDYLVTEAGSVKGLTLAPDYASSLRNTDNRADYLIVAPREFAGTAEALREYRLGRFADVEIAWLDDVYDEFSGGREDPAAIGLFMQRAEQWQVPPSHVVLIGKSSVDHKDRLGYGDSFLPALMTSTPWALAPSDDRLLGIEDPTSAGFALGRLPITNDAEGLDYVEKLAEYEARVPGNERFKAVLAADNPDDAGDFHANSDALADLLVQLGLDDPNLLYHPYTAVGDTLAQSPTWEAAYVSYDGHGSITNLGTVAEGFLDADVAGALENGVYPLFTAMTCASGDDTYPDYRSLAGALVLNPMGGAMASVAPTGLSLDADAQTLGTLYVESLLGDRNTIGDALRAAKAQSAGSISPFMSRIYSVVGDPAVLPVTP